MKTFFLLIIIICISQLCYSQITKNSWLLGGSASFSNTINTQGNASEITNITISPNVGYFVFDKFALGSRLSFTSSYVEQQPVKTNFYAVGPFARYYLLSTDKMFNILTQTNYEIKLNNNLNGAINTFSVLGGPVIFLNDNVALEFNLGYATTNFKNNDLKINTFQSGISLQIHLNK